MWYLIGVTALSGLAGAWFLRLADERIAQAEAGFPEHTDGFADPVGDGKDGEGAICPRVVSAACLTALCAALAAFMCLFYGDDPASILPVTLLCAVLWACARCDRKMHLIPNSVLLWAVVLRALLLASEVFFSPAELPYDLIRSAIAAAALFVVGMLCRLAAKGSIGFGDIKLLAVMGFYLETDRIWGSVFFTMLCSFLYSLFLLVTKRGTTKSAIAFAPLLLAGTVLASFLTSV